MLGQVWYLNVSIPDFCLLVYFKFQTAIPHSILNVLNIAKLYALGIKVYSVFTVYYGVSHLLYRTKVKTLHYNYLYFVRKNWTKSIN